MNSLRRVRDMRLLVGALAIAALTTVNSRVAGAIDLIPSYGVTQSTDDNSGDPRGFGGLALRASLLPFLKIEGGIAYRQDSFLGDDLKVRQWPVTASAWVTPFPFIYAGGGVGWYRTTFDYRGVLPIEDATTKTMGVHAGGGVSLPIGPKLGLDLNGRYIFMQEDNSGPQVPTTFDPDFWSLTLGLAIKL